MTVTVSSMTVAVLVKYHTHAEEGGREGGREGGYMHVHVIRMGGICLLNDCI